MGKTKRFKPSKILPHVAQTIYFKLVRRSAQPKSTQIDPNIVDFIFTWSGVFDNLTQAQASSCAKYFEARHINSGNYICKEGHESQSLFIVYKGELRTKIPRSNSVDAPATKRFGKYDLVQPGNFALKTPWTQDVFARGDAIVLQIKREDFEKARQHSGFESFTRKLVSEAHESIIRGIKRSPLLSLIREDMLSKAAECFDVRCFRQGERVLCDGEPVTTLYLIYGGSVILAYNDKSGVFEVEIARFTLGDTLGEKALLDSDSTRLGNVYALEDTICFVLKDEKLQDFAKFAPLVITRMQRTMFDRSSVSSASQKIQFVESLPQQKQYLLSKLCVHEKYMPHQAILREGSSVTDKKFYIISHGELTVSVRNKRIRFLREGDYFGEMSLFDSNPTSASVTVSSSTPVTCLEFSKATFESLLLNEPAVLAEIAIKCVGRKCQLSHVLNHPYARNIFIHHCTKEFAKENVHFWCEVEDLKSFQKRLYLSRTVMKLKGQEFDATKKAMLKSKIESIYRRFIADSAEEGINVSSRNTEEITRRYSAGDFAFDIFDKARREIYDLMDTDVFPRFKASPSFEKMLRMIGCYHIASEDIGPKFRESISKSAHDAAVEISIQ